MIPPASRISVAPSGGVGTSAAEVDEAGRGDELGRDADARPG